MAERQGISNTKRSQNLTSLWISIKSVIRTKNKWYFNRQLKNKDNTWWQHNHGALKALKCNNPLSINHQRLIGIKVKASRAWWIEAGVNRTHQNLDGSSLLIDIMRITNNNNRHLSLKVWSLSPALRPLPLTITRGCKRLLRRQVNHFLKSTAMPR